MEIRRTMASVDFVLSSECELIRVGDKFRKPKAHPKFGSYLPIEHDAQDHGQGNKYTENHCTNGTDQDDL